MSIKLDMTNIYGTTEYAARRAYAEPVFAPEFKGEEETVQLDFGYRLVQHAYSGQIGQYRIHATENFLFAENGEEIYRWRNIDDDAEFAKIIAHQNGGAYLIFRVDLYGYGVLDLQTGQKFIHIPREKETFIWVDVNYNRTNNILAVSGCYWACPYSTVLLDFSDPMRQTEWIDLHEQLDSGFWLYDDIDFVRWDGESLAVKYAQDDKYQEMIIGRERYQNWMTHKTVTLFRPVNQAELDLIAQADYEAFPPRLPEQPIFYPVCNAAYAIEIAEKWNVPAYGMSFVLRFEVDAGYLSGFEIHRVGDRSHEEYWIPAEELPDFNDHIRGKIEVAAKYENKTN